MTSTIQCPNRPFFLSLSMIERWRTGTACHTSTQSMLQIGKYKSGLLHTPWQIIRFTTSRYDSTSHLTRSTHRTSMIIYTARFRTQFILKSAFLTLQAQKCIPNSKWNDREFRAFVLQNTILRAHGTNKAVPHFCLSSYDEYKTNFVNHFDRVFERPWHWEVLTEWIFMVKLRCRQEIAKSTDVKTDFRSSRVVIVDLWNMYACHTTCHLEIM